MKKTDARQNNTQDAGSDFETENEYTVEKILNKRVKNGIVEYFLKWEGYSEDENSWEPEHNIYYKELIENYEKELKMKELKKEREPESIVGVTNSSGQITFLIKWKNMDVTDLISNKKANMLYPEVVIRFYEESIGWR